MTTCGESASDYLKGSFKDAEKFVQGGAGPAYSDAGTIYVLFHSTGWTRFNSDMVRLIPWIKKIKMHDLTSYEMTHVLTSKMI